MTAARLCDAVREARTSRAWSQARLAAEAGVNDKTVRRVERGDAVAQETILALCATLDLDVSTLALPRPPAPPPADLPADARQRAFVASVSRTGARAGDVVSWPTLIPLPTPLPAGPARSFAAKASLSLSDHTWIWLVALGLVAFFSGWVSDLLFGALCLGQILLGLYALPVLDTSADGIAKAVRAERDERDRVTAYVLGCDAVAIHTADAAGIREVVMPLASLRSVDVAEEEGCVTATVSGVLGTLVLDRMPASQAVEARLAEWVAACGTAGRHAA